MENKTIVELVKDIHGLAKEKGWWDGGDRNFGELLMLVTSELAEALEEYRKGYGITEIYFDPNGDPDGCPTKPEGVPIEIADAIIRLFDICGHYDIDIGTLVQIKHEFNKTRPYRHGNKKA